MTSSEQAFLAVLPLCISFVALPAWRGPIASVSSAARDLMSACRAHALRTCPSAYGGACTFRGRMRISDCWACGETVPVYPLRRGEVQHLYYETLGGSPPHSDDGDNYDADDRSQSLVG